MNERSSFIRVQSARNILTYQTRYHMYNLKVAQVPIPSTDTLTRHLSAVMGGLIALKNASLCSLDP